MEIFETAIYVILGIMTIYCIDKNEINCIPLTRANPVVKMPDP